MNYKRLIFLIVFLFVSIQIVGGQIPSYKLVIVPNKFTVNPGESLDFKIHLSGIGHVKMNKISFFVPPNLLDSNNPGSHYDLIECVEINGTKKAKIVTEPEPKPFKNMIAVSLVECNFVFEESPPSNFSAPLTIGEDTPPLLIHFNIADNAIPGDYNIKLILTYSMDGIKWYQDEKEVTIHVNSWAEEHEFWFVIITAIVIAAFLWLASLWWDAVKGIDDSYYKGKLAKIFISYILTSIILLGIAAIGIVGLKLSHYLIIGILLFVSIVYELFFRKKFK